jgi:hydroxymethylpyrimidine pyrophosphatase-like HAD family hydrolase
MKYNKDMAAIICDIDDTLLRNGSQPIKNTIDWVNERAKNYKIILVTGRNVSQRSETVRALRKAGVRYNRLIMNPGSSADTAEYKKEVGKRLKSSERVVLAIDNNEKMRAAYSSSGIKTIHPSQLSDSVLKLNIVF